MTYANARAMVWNAEIFNPGAVILACLFILATPEAPVEDIQQAAAAADQARLRIH
jgi:hypothetical protein